MTSELWTDPRFPGVACRRATVDDLPALLTLRSRRETDYLPQVLPDWIRDRPGGVYAYYYEGQLCGLCSIHLPKPGEAWLRGKRIAVGFEGRGIGTATAVFELLEARRLGARVARLVAAEGNAAVHRMMREKLGFREAARWWIAQDVHPDRLLAGAGDAGGAVTVLAAADLRDGGAALLEPLLRAHGQVGGATQPGTPGFGAWGLTACARDPLTLQTLATEDVLADVERDSVLAVSGPPGAPTGLILTSALTPLRLHVRLFVARTEDAAPALRRWLRDRAAAALDVSLPVPHARALAATGDGDQLLSIGGQVFIVYERPLDDAV